MAIGFLRSSSSRTRRIVAIAIFFILAVAATSVGALTELSQEDASSINNEIEQMRNSVTVQFIFGNNLFICLLMFVPFVGWFFGFWILYNTGVAIAAQSMSGAALGIPPLALFFSLFLFPFTWMEFIAYSTALAEGFWLMFRAVQSQVKRGVSFRRELKNASTLITIVTLILLAAAAIEVALIMATGG